MIQLLYILILVEMAVLLLFLSPMRKIAIIAIDHAKRGKFIPMIVITTLTHLLAMLIYNIYCIVKFRRRLIDANLADLTNQLLMVEKLLEASLIGFLLFLFAVIDRLHLLMREQVSLEKIIKAEEKHLAERNFLAAKHLRASEKEINTLKLQVKKVESELEARKNEAKAAEAKVLTLRKQSEEYDRKYSRVIEYNQILQNQLQSNEQSLLEEKQKRGWPNFKSNIMSGGFIQFPWGSQTCNSRRVGSEIELQRTDRFCTVSHAAPSARHRRPIYIDGY